MFSNYRYPLVLFIASFAFMMAAMLLKIMNWPGSSLLFGSMLMVQAFSIIWLMVVLLKKR
ncbi:hypothetical protein [Mucilaginibacter gotjawali]|uniref:Uncharacterized protein n=2 Tax=Mucilaginibacter gotjawali TaxID=1550579 RepID=A0A839SMH8_9SPHI|nr:hypothetical protein [Mucilaginibacter gotjawali]MBB3058563.1 hypothetical protein [Mucilaginibacter gotjawali]BAU52471.1 hypothetical protein MgSA37_00632 [Mucilaginibacter gotjawali]